MEEGTFLLSFFFPPPQRRDYLSFFFVRTFLFLFFLFKITVCYLVLSTLKFLFLVFFSRAEKKQSLEDFT